MRYTYLVTISIILILFLSCSESLIYREDQIVSMAVAVDANFKIILPKTLNDGINCFNYGSGCIRGKMAEVRKVVMILVEFKTEDEAKSSAAAIGEYYSRNYLFDDVVGEPVLEDFVKRSFNAKRASKADI